MILVHEMQLSLIEQRVEMLIPNFMLEYQMLDDNLEMILFSYDQHTTISWSEIMVMYESELLHQIQLLK